jgi:5-methylcytosine-specific restriction endonuclease McrA
MNHTVDIMLLKNLLKPRTIPQIHFKKRKITPRQFPNTSYSLGLTIREIVSRNNIIPLLQQLQNRVTANITRSACNKDFHSTLPKPYVYQTLYHTRPHNTIALS